MSKTNQDITIEATSSGATMPNWLANHLLTSPDQNILVIYPNELARNQFLRTASQVKPSLDSSKHLTISRLVTSLLTDLRQPPILDNDNEIKIIIHSLCEQAAQKGEFPFAHNFASDSPWSTYKTDRLDSLHKEISKLTSWKWREDPGVKTYRNILYKVEKKLTGIHPHLAKHRLIASLSELKENEKPFSLNEIDGIIILDHPPDFTPVEIELFITLSNIIPLHQLCTGGSFRLGYHGAYIEDKEWCTQESLPKWVPPHEVPKENHKVRWQSSNTRNIKPDYHRICVDRAEHTLDAAMNLLSRIDIEKDTTIAIIDAAKETRKTIWAQRLHELGIELGDNSVADNSTLVNKELLYHLSIGLGLEAWSFERFSRMVNSKFFSISLLNNDELIHPSNEAIRPRPHLDILEDISAGFHVLGGCGALERWIKILQQTQNKIGIDQTEIDIKQEETLWWLANVGKLWSIVSEEKLPFNQVVGGHTNSELPLLSSYDSGTELVSFLASCIQWDNLSQDDMQFNQIYNSINELMQEISLTRDIYTKNKLSFPKDSNEFVDIIKEIIHENKENYSRLSNNNVKLMTPSEGFGTTSDVLILAGLDSDSWSMKSDNVPWLDSASRLELGLLNFDEKIRQARHHLRHLVNCGSTTILIDTSNDESAGPAAPLSEWLEEIKQDGQAIFSPIPYFLKEADFDPKNVKRCWDLVNENQQSWLKLRLFSVDEYSGKTLSTRSGYRGRDIRQRSGLALRTNEAMEVLPNSVAAIALAHELPFNTEKLNQQASHKSTSNGEALKWSERESMVGYAKLNLRPSKSALKSETNRNPEWPHLGIRINGNLVGPAIDPRPLPLFNSVNTQLSEIIGNTNQSITNKQWSPYRLQSWIKCPRQAWLKDYLKLDKFSNPSEDIDNRTRGNLIHNLEAEILAKHGVPIADKPLQSGTPLCLGKFGKIEDLWTICLQYLEDQIPWLSRNNAVSIHRCKEIIGVDSSVWKQHIDGEITLQPVGRLSRFLISNLDLQNSAPIVCEWIIQHDDGKPITITGKNDLGEDKEFAIRGRVDRVDCLHFDDKSDTRYIIIRDIKTVNGPKPGDEGDRHRRAIYDELQLALYAKAWESAYPKDVVVGVGISEVGATTKHYVEIDHEYKSMLSNLEIGDITEFTTKSHRYKGEEKPFEGNKFRAWLEERVTTAIRAIEGAEAGNFNPTVSDDCKYCAVRQLCPSSTIGCDE